MLRVSGHYWMSIGERRPEIRLPRIQNVLEAKIHSISCILNSSLIQLTPRLVIWRSLIVCETPRYGVKHKASIIVPAREFRQ